MEPVLRIVDAIKYRETADERVFEALVNQPRRTPAHGPSTNQLTAMALGRRTAQAVESITFWCHVLILKVISAQPWYYFSCALCQCKKGVIKVANEFPCSSCEDVCSLALPSYRVQLEETNGISIVVITLFDEIAERLIKKPAHDLLSNWDIDNDPLALPSEISCLHGTSHVMELKSHTYYDHGTYESFACSAIFKPTPGMMVGVVSLDAVGIMIPGVDNLSAVLPELSWQLHLNSVGHHRLTSNDTSLTELLSIVRRHLRLGGQLHNNSAPIAHLNYPDPALTQLLYMGREHENKNQESVAFACKVLIKMIRPYTPWCYLACDICKINEGISDVGGAYWCGICTSIYEVPTIRYRLEMEVTNGQTTIVAILHNREAEILVKQAARNLLTDFQVPYDCYQIPPEIINLSNTYQFLEFKTHTYIDHQVYESFVCNRILKSDYRNGDSNTLTTMDRNITVISEEQ